MKRFHFPLESLLRYREHRERVAQQNLAKAQAAVIASEQRLKSLGESKSQGEKQMDEEMTQGMESHRFQNYLSYLKGIGSEKVREEQQHRNLQRVKSRERTVLARRAKEKKVLENLKSRRKEAYYEEMARVLQKESDDMVSVRKAREINR